MAGFNTRTLVIISRLPRRPPFHSFQTQEPQVPMELTFSACFASRNMPPYLSSPGTNPPGSGAVIFLAAIWNYKLPRRRPQNQAKWLKRLPRGQREVFTPQRGPIYLYFFNHREFPSFFFFFAAQLWKWGTAPRWLWKQALSYKWWRASWKTVLPTTLWAPRMETAAILRALCPSPSPAPPCFPGSHLIESPGHTTCWPDSWLLFHSGSAAKLFLPISGLYKESAFFLQAVTASAAVLKHNFTLFSSLRAYLRGLFGGWGRAARISKIHN